MSHSFFGGIVFPARVERKAPAASRPLEEFTPSLLVLSMRQGFGGECEPAVSPGDQVLVGSVVGRSRTALPLRSTRGYREQSWRWSPARRPTGTR